MIMKAESSINKEIVVDSILTTVPEISQIPPYYGFPETGRL